MPDINTKVKLTGEAEYKQAMSNINASMKVLNSEMKLTTAQFAENGKSVDALKAKNEILNKSIATQEEKLNLMKAQLQKTAQAYGEGSEKTLKLKAAVNNAETELVQMKNSLQENEQAIEQASEKSGAFGDTLQNVADKLGIKLPQSVTGANSALNRVKTSAALITAGFTALAKAVVDVEKKLFNMAKEAASAADELNTLSKQTGVSTQQLQEFQYASELVDVSMETLQGSLTKLTANMAKAQEGSGDAADTFKKLGVEIENSDGSLRNANDVFLEAIDALGKMQNQTERDATAMDIFGKSAQDLNPLIEAGSEKLRELGKDAEQAGYILSTDALNALNDMDDAMQKLNKTQEGLKKQLSAEFAPYATKAIESVTEAFKSLGDMVKKSGIVDAFGMLLEDATSIIKPIDDLSKNKLPALQTALNGVAKLCAAISDTVSVIANAVGLIVNFDIFNMSKAKTNWSNLIQSSGITNNNRYQQISRLQEGNAINQATLANGYGEYYANGKYYASYDAYLQEQWINSGDNEFYDFTNWKIKMGYNAGGTQNWRGGWSWVGESGPELAYLPQGTQIKNATESREVGGDTFNITIDAKNVREFNDIVQLAKNARMRKWKEAAIG